MEKISGKPSLPKDMAEPVVAVIREEYERLGKNLAALGRHFGRSPQSLVHILDGLTTPSMETASRVAKARGLDVWELLRPGMSTDARQRISDLETQVRVLTQSLDRATKEIERATKENEQLEKAIEALRISLAPRLTLHGEAELTSAGNAAVANQKAMRDVSAPADIPTNSREQGASGNDSATGSGIGPGKRDPVRKRRS